MAKPMKRLRGAEGKIIADRKDGVMRLEKVAGAHVLLVLMSATLTLMAMAIVVAEAADVAAGESEQPTVRTSAGGGENTTTEGSVESKSRYVVYYFHGERRCRTCRTIEAYAEELVKSRLAKELRAGSLAWKVINYDEPENKHFIEDFGLVSASLVVAEMNGDEPVRFEVLQKAWFLVRDKPGFDRYLLWSIVEYMDETG